MPAAQEMIGVRRQELGGGDGFPPRWTANFIERRLVRDNAKIPRRAAVEHPDPLRLVSTPPPSTAVTEAEFVGNYAIRLTWADGHATGIYPFTGLRACCPCPDCNPEGPPPLIND